MPSPLEASGAPLCCSPVDPEDDKHDQVPERYVGQNDAEARGACGLKGSGCQTRRKSACRWKLGTSSARSARQSQAPASVCVVFRLFWYARSMVKPCRNGGFLRFRARSSAGEHTNRAPTRRSLGSRKRVTPIPFIRDRMRGSPPPTLSKATPTGPPPNSPKRVG